MSTKKQGAIRAYKAKFNHSPPKSWTARQLTSAVIKNKPSARARSYGQYQKKVSKLEMRARKAENFAKDKTERKQNRRKNAKREISRRKRAKTARKNAVMPKKKAGRRAVRKTINSTQKVARKAAVSLHGSPRMIRSMERVARRYLERRGDMGFDAYQTREILNKQMRAMQDLAKNSLKKTAKVAPLAKTAPSLSAIQREMNRVRGGQEAYLAARLKVLRQKEKLARRAAAKARIPINRKAAAKILAKNRGSVASRLAAKAGGHAGRLLLRAAGTPLAVGFAVSDGSRGYKKALKETGSRQIAQREGFVDGFASFVSMGFMQNAASNIRHRREREAAALTPALRQQFPAVSKDLTGLQSYELSQMPAGKRANYLQKIKNDNAASAARWNSVLGLFGLGKNSTKAPAKARPAKPAPARAVPGAAQRTMPKSATMQKTGTHKDNLAKMGMWMMALKATEMVVSRHPVVRALTHAFEHTAQHSVAAEAGKISNRVSDQMRQKGAQKRHGSGKGQTKASQGKKVGMIDPGKMGKPHVAFANARKNANKIVANGKKNRDKKPVKHAGAKIWVKASGNRKGHWRKNSKYGKTKNGS